jgi:hypothetical protein
MDDRPALTAVNGTTPTIHTACARWSPIPPKPVRKAAYQRLKKARRPVGTLAVPAIATTGSLYYTGVIAHSDGAMTLGLTALVVFYDSVIAVCRSWHRSSATATTETSRAPAVKAS